MYWLLHRSIASSICHKGQSERTFLIFAFSSRFSPFPDFFPLFPNFWQIFRCWWALCPLDPPVATPLVLHHTFILYCGAHQTILSTPDVCLPLLHQLSYKVKVSKYPGFPKILNLETFNLQNVMLQILNQTWRTQNWVPLLSLFHQTSPPPQEPNKPELL